MPDCSGSRDRPLRKAKSIRLANHHAQDVVVWQGHGDTIPIGTHFPDLALMQLKQLCQETNLVVDVVHCIGALVARVPRHLREEHLWLQVDILHGTFREKLFQVHVFLPDCLYTCRITRPSLFDHVVMGRLVLQALNLILHAPTEPDLDPEHFRDT